MDDEKNISVTIDMINMNMFRGTLLTEMTRQWEMTLYETPILPRGGSLSDSQGNFFRSLFVYILCAHR